MNRVGRKGYKISFHVVGLLWDFRYLLTKGNVSRVVEYGYFCPYLQYMYLLSRRNVFVTEPCFPLAGGLCNFYANARRKRRIQCQPLLVKYKQEANPLLSMHKYTPLVISGNDKNKQLTLLSRHKLALTARNTLCVIKSLGHLKN
jgi:hypothetical protein